MILFFLHLLRFPSATSCRLSPRLQLFSPTRFFRHLWHLRASPAKPVDAFLPFLRHYLREPLPYFIHEVSSAENAPPPQPGKNLIRLTLHPADAFGVSFSGSPPSHAAFTPPAFIRELGSKCICLSESLGFSSCLPFTIASHRHRTSGDVRRRALWPSRSRSLWRLRRTHSDHLFILGTPFRVHRLLSLPPSCVLQEAVLYAGARRALRPDVMQI